MSDITDEDVEKLIIELHTNNKLEKFLKILEIVTNDNIDDNHEIDLNELFDNKPIVNEIDGLGINDINNPTLEKKDNQNE
jgi:hypothetical protein